MGDAPENFVYDSSTNILSWDPVAGAEAYEIQSALLGSEDWTVIYLGTSTETVYKPIPGAYKVRGRLKKSGSWGLPGATTNIVVS